MSDPMSITVNDLPDESPAIERPSWLPEKFNSPEDMAAAYASLETKLGTPVAPQVADSLTIDVPQAPEVDLTTPLDWNPLLDKHSKSEMTNEDYELLALRGYDKDFADSYLAGQVALGDRLISAAQQVAGGKEQFQALKEWAATNLSKDQIQSFQKGLSGGTKADVEFAVTGLKALYTQANGSQPQLLSVSGASTASSGSFTTQAEVATAFADPRYKTDEAYRQSVYARM